MEYILFAAKRPYRYVCMMMCKVQQPVARVEIVVMCCVYFVCLVVKANSARSGDHIYHATHVCAVLAAAQSNTNLNMRGDTLGAK